MVTNRTSQEPVAGATTRYPSVGRVRVPKTAALAFLEAGGLILLTAALMWSLAAEPLDVDEGDLLHPANLILPLVWIVVLLDPKLNRRNEWTSGLDFYVSAASAAIPAAGIAATALLALKVPIHRRFFFACLIAGTLWLIVCRFVFRQVVTQRNRQGKGVESAAVIVLDEVDCDPVGRIVDDSRNGFNALGWFGDAGIGGVRALGEHLGPVDEIASICTELGIREVIANGASISPGMLEQVAWELRPIGVGLTIVVDVSYASAPGVKLRSAYGVTVGEVSAPGIRGLRRGAKRMFDIVGAAIALTLVWPLMILVCAAILIEDGAPVLFRQKRVGQSLSEFECLKFRSMTKDAHLKEAALRKKLHKAGSMWKVENDPRVTKVGRVIRALSLDELPQLLNVLRGDMSLVGPRPKQSWELKDYSETQLRRFSVKPGITGLSQVSGRSNLSLDEAVELDLEYLRNWGLLRDLFICAKTVRAVLARSGAS